MPQYTTEELIQYAYGETSAEKTYSIERALETDWDLKEKLDALKKSMHQLDTVISSPREQSVMAILNYAKRTSAVEQP
jgi:anti-sigma-K factor RskA